VVSRLNNDGQMVLCYQLTVLRSSVCIQCTVMVALGPNLQDFVKLSRKLWKNMTYKRFMEKFDLQKKPCHKVTVRETYSKVVEKRTIAYWLTYKSIKHAVIKHAVIKFIFSNFMLRNCHTISSSAVVYIDRH